VADPFTTISPPWAPLEPHVCICNLCDAQMERYQNERDYTHGNFATEAESVNALLEILHKIDLFNIYREVRGTYLHPRPGVPPQTPRIDVILGPKQELIDKGWTHGFVGIECKRSHEKIGRPISQMLDYSRAVWDIDAAGRRVMLNWVFLWPLHGQGGPIASVMAQNRIGNIVMGHNTCLYFQSCGTIAMVGVLGVDLRETTQGQKVGSR